MADIQWHLNSLENENFAQKCGNVPSMLFAQRGQHNGNIFILMNNMEIIFLSNFRTLPITNCSQS